MAFRTSSSISSGDEIDRGEHTEVPASKTIRIVMTKDADSDAFDEEHQIKLEVADKPTCPSSDEEEMDFGALQVKIEPMDIDPISFSDSTRRQSPPQKSKSDYILRSCPHCPYKNYNARIYENHLKAHLPGSTARPCTECGYYVFPQNQRSHQAFHRLEAFKTAPQVDPLAPDFNQQSSNDDHDVPYAFPVLVKLEEGLGEVVETELDSAHPDNILETDSGYSCPNCAYKSIYRRRVLNHLNVHEPGALTLRCQKCGTDNFVKNSCKCLQLQQSSGYTIRKKIGRRLFRCCRCPFKTYRKPEIETHVLLHAEGSSAVPWKVCRVYVAPEQLQLHQDTNHPPPQPKKPKVKKILKCPHCPHESKHSKFYEEHLALHSEGSGGIECPDCDVYYRPNTITTRHKCGKWKLRKKYRLMMAKGVGRLGKSKPASPL